MECDPTRVCELLVGLGDVEVLGVDDAAGGPLRVHIRCRQRRPCCGGCGGPVWSKGERGVELAWSLGLSLIAALVQFLAQRWKGEFSIEQLIGGYVSLAGRNRILELDVAATLENHYIANKTRLYVIRWCLVIQALVAVGGVLVLIRFLLLLA